MGASMRYSVTLTNQLWELPKLNLFSFVMGIIDWPITK